MSEVTPPTPSPSGLEGPKKVFRIKTPFVVTGNVPKVDAATARMDEMKYRAAADRTREIAAGFNKDGFKKVFGTDLNGKNENVYYAVESMQMALNTNFNSEVKENGILDSATLAAIQKNYPEDYQLLMGRRNAA